MLQILKDYWFLFSAAAVILGYAALYLLSEKFVRKKDYETETEKARDEIEEYMSAEVSSMLTQIDRVEKLLTGFQDLLSQQNSMIQKLETRVSEIEKYGSAPLRKMEENINEMMGRLREVKTHLNYLARIRDKDLHEDET